MKGKAMNDEMRKALTEYLGECWHQMERIHPGGIFKRCYKCLKPESEGITNRTFTTWEDLGALKNKLVEKGDWRDFFGFARNSWDEANVNNWLMVPARFCELVGEWLGKQEGGKG